MTALYIVSSESGVGKTAIAAGLGRCFEVSGKTVRFTEATIGNNLEDSASQAAFAAARDLKAKVIIIAAYAGKPALQIAGSYLGFKDTAAGLVLNKVPQSQLGRAREEAALACEKTNIKFLGAMPEDRSLVACTVGELAQTIAGKVLNNEEKANDLVENLMLGALVVDSGPEYFARKDKKAAVIRGDRPDMQLAVLETATKCLVLSNSSQSPIPNVMIKANRKSVPIILSEKSTDAVITAIEDMLANARFNREGKIDRLAAIIQQHLDFKIIDEWAVG
ncbi:MAG: DRTGG domain-containing protein [Dehalococcoidales bacterium]|nr:DRTGG domain-containing protein [Dehalococcoidales bacterium]